MSIANAAVRWTFGGEPSGKRSWGVVREMSIEDEDVQGEGE